jgi:alpha-glucosidase (family GH31 glycosyl hydrolase)
MDSEFLLGDDILVAPVLEEGLTARHNQSQETVAEFIDPYSRIKSTPA